MDKLPVTLKLLETLSGCILQHKVIFIALFIWWIIKNK